MSDNCATKTPNLFFLGMMNQLRQHIGLCIPMRASVFCRKISLGVGAGSELGAVVVADSEGTGLLAVGIDLAMDKNSWMSL